MDKYKELQILAEPLQEWLKRYYPNKKILVDEHNAMVFEFDIECSLPKEDDYNG